MEKVGLNMACFECIVEHFVLVFILIYFNVVYKFFIPQNTMFQGVLNGNTKLKNISSTKDFFPNVIININFALKVKLFCSYKYLVTCQNFLHLFFPYCNSVLQKTWLGNILEKTKPHIHNTYFLHVFFVFLK